MSGIFVAIEGVDGAGKSTQVDRLARTWREQGDEVTVVREPGGTALGERIRALLLDSDLELTAESEALLFLSSRVQLYEQVIRPALDRGERVISDRFHLSTIVYQGAAGDLGVDHARDLCRLVLGERRPDLNIVLDVSEAVARSRRKGTTPDRIERDTNRIERARTAFSVESGIDGDAIVRIDATGDADAVYEAIHAAVTVHAVRR